MNYVLYRTVQRCIAQSTRVESHMQEPGARIWPDLGIYPSGSLIFSPMAFYIEKHYTIERWNNAAAHNFVVQ